MKELWVTILESLGLVAWIEVTTESPRCTYYFGPFATFREAEAAKGGYLEDLAQEGAQGIKAAVLRCKPNSLTIDEEAFKPADRPSSLVSG